MKNVLRVLYIGFAFIVAIFVYIIGYDSNTYSYIQNLTSNAISEKDYVDVAKIHGGCFYAESIITDESDKYDIAIFPSANLSTYNYFTSEEIDATECSDYIYENSYYIYVFSPQYENENLVTDKVFNKTGLRFNSNSSSYDYYFTVSATLNNDQYKATPLSRNEAALNVERTGDSYFSNWGFYNVILTETQINAMGLDGNISSIDIIDSYGEVVDTLSVSLDFSHKFFDYISPLSVEYNKFINEYNEAITAKNNDLADEIEDNFNLFYDGDEENNQAGFKDTFFEVDEKNSFRHDDKYLRPVKLVWSTIGMICLYLICAALLYALLFHFNTIKALVFRDKSNTYRKGYGAYNKANTIDAKVSDVKTSKETKAIEMKKEEATEEIKSDNE